MEDENGQNMELNMHSKIDDIVLRKLYPINCMILTPFLKIILLYMKIKDYASYYRNISNRTKIENKIHSFHIYS